MNTRRQVATALAFATASLAMPALVAGVDDTTPPQVSIDINDGAAYVAFTGITVTVEATDDASGIAKLELSNDGSTWTDVGLYSSIGWYLAGDASNRVFPGVHTLHARVTDGAGNQATTTDSITADLAPPVSTVDIAAWDPTTQVVRLAFQATDPAGIGQVHIYCNSEGPLLVEYAPEIEVTLDASIGPNCAGYGSRVIHIQINDTVGNGVNHQLGVDVPFVVGVEYPRTAVTGASFTIRPVYPDGFVLDPDTVCRHEFRWGSDAALFQNETDSTFGGLLFEGPASAGYCGDWTFTLPWVPVQKFNWTFSGPNGSWVNEVFSASVGNTNPKITSSNIPLVYVLPSSRTLTVGVPVTYTLYRLGGAGGNSPGEWTGYLVGSGATTGTEVAFHQTGGSTFVLTPTRPGDWNVGWNPSPGYPWVLGAYYDPAARAGASGGGGGSVTPPPAVAATTEPSGAASSTPGFSASPKPVHPSPTLGDLAAVEPSASPRGEMPAVIGPTSKSTAQWALLAVTVVLVGGGLALGNSRLRARLVAAIAQLKSRG